jgi:predicted O-methyltransferase YrrM
MRRLQAKAAMSRVEVTSDWFTHNVPKWEEYFARLGWGDESELHILEVGSWEGLSSVYLLTKFPKSSIVCVDTWQGGDEHQATGVLGSIEDRFENNISKFGVRVEKYKGTSESYFMSSLAEPSFDLVYIDGSHRADDVYSDACGGVNRLRPGGLMILDDLLWRFYATADENPAKGIDQFLEERGHEVSVVDVGYQLVLKREELP